MQICPGHLDLCLSAVHMPRFVKPHLGCIVLEFSENMLYPSLQSCHKAFNVGCISITFL